MIVEHCSADEEPAKEGNLPDIFDELAVAVLSFKTRDIFGVLKRMVLGDDGIEKVCNELLTLVNNVVKQISAMCKKITETETETDELHKTLLTETVETLLSQQRLLDRVCAEIGALRNELSLTNQRVADCEERIQNEAFETNNSS